MAFHACLSDRHMRDLLPKVVATKSFTLTTMISLLEDTISTAELLQQTQSSRAQLQLRNLVEGALP